MQETDAIHTLNILRDKKPVELDIFTATIKELEQAKSDLNNKSIRQAFDDNQDVRGIRAGLHALILNQLNIHSFK